MSNRTKAEPNVGSPHSYGVDLASVYLVLDRISRPIATMFRTTKMAPNTRKTRIVANSWWSDSAPKSRGTEDTWRGASKTKKAIIAMGPDVGPKKRQRR